MSLFETGIRPAVDAHIQKLSEEERDYGDYWSASSAGFCMRLNVMRRLGVPPVPEIAEGKAILQRTFSAGHIFHEWMQRITKEAGLSIAQELELQDEELMIRGHIDDLVLVKSIDVDDVSGFPAGTEVNVVVPKEAIKQHLILYDYKTVHSDSFNYKRDKIGHYHTHQLGTYMYMLRKLDLENWRKAQEKAWELGETHSHPENQITNFGIDLKDLTEARRLNISKDDLRMSENQLMWDDSLEKVVEGYWMALNGFWKSRKMPPCTCLEHDGGFMGRRSKKGKIYNDFFYEDEPCSLKWYELNKKKERIASSVEQKKAG